MEHPAIHFGGIILIFLLMFMTNTMGASAGGNNAETDEFWKKPCKSVYKGQ